MAGRQSGQEGPASVGEMMVLLEDIRSKVTVVAEGHSGLVRQIGGNREAIERLERRVEKFEEPVIKGFKGLWEAVGSQTKSVNVLTGRFDTLAGRLDSVSERLDAGFERLGKQLEEHVHSD